MNKKRIISYVTTYDALNVHNWSGLGYYIAKSLEQQKYELDYIGNLKLKTNIKERLKSKVYKIILNKTFSLDREPDIIDQYAKQILAKMRPDSDLVFSPGTIPISLLETNKPKVFYTDATFAGMLDFYDNFSNYCKETIRHGCYIEQKALDSAKMAIYSSDWAAQTAIDNYDVNPDKIKVVPFGANIEGSKTYNEIQTIVSARPVSECHLLLLGVEWKRKGGNMAVEVAKKLNDMGIKTVLHIAGIKNIPLSPIPPFIVNHGFISKANNEGKERLNSLLSKCHFLILPVKAEAYGLVFCESNSFGVPCISNNVGGVSTIIKNGINGMLFSVNDSAEAYATYIQSVFTNQKAYNELAYSSFNEYSQRLNWDVAGKALARLLEMV